MIKYRKSWEVIGVTTEEGEFFCRGCLDETSAEWEDGDRPVFLSDEFSGLCDRCGIDSGAI
jgi:hypothetical protein